jgi:hypothetical protein
MKCIRSASFFRVSRLNNARFSQLPFIGTYPPSLSSLKLLILLFSLALQPSAGYGLLVHEVS